MNELEGNASLFDQEELAAVEVLPPPPTEDQDVILVEGFRELKESQQRKMRMLNKHLLLKYTPTEGLFQLPKVLPYRGEIPDVFIPYSAKVCYNSEYKGVYCHIDDSGFNSTWTPPNSGVEKGPKIHGGDCSRQYLMG